MTFWFWLGLGLALYLLIGLLLAWRVRARGTEWLTVPTLWLPIGVLIVAVAMCLPDQLDPYDW